MGKSILGSDFTPDVAILKSAGNRKRSPRTGIHIAKEVFFPRELRMLLQVFSSLEIDPAGVSGGSGKGHMLSQGSVSNLVLDGAGSPVRGLPRLRAAR